MADLAPDSRGETGLLLSMELVPTELDGPY